jgi:SAM-dependent methyltransferase
MRRPGFIARHSGRPDGFLGRLILGVMAHETARFNDEILDELAPSTGERILELGYGHGRTLVAAARRSAGVHLAGIDVSPTAARAAARRCRAAVRAGGLDLRTGDAVSLPWGDQTFDAVFSVHTLYFWPEPARQLAELARVIRPGGRLVLGYRERSDEAVTRFPPPTYRFHADDEVAGMLEHAAFTAVATRAATAAAGLRIATATR